MLFAYFHLKTTWMDIGKKTVHEIDEDNCFGLAAQLAFYFLLALFPALLFLVALISYLPVEAALADLITALNAVAPREILTLVREQLDTVAQGNHAGLLTLGIIGAIWSSSAAMVAIIDALNHAYDVNEWRPWWKRRLVAIVLTVALSVFILIALTFVLIGPALALRIAEWFGFAPTVAIVWQIVRVPVMILSIVLAIDLVYHFAPNRAGPWTWITPGSLLATGSWLASSFGFRFYVTNLADYNATYGAIGGVIVTMLWFYVCGLTMLIGAELNGVLEHEWRSRRMERRA
jgi:membrane protein